MNARTPKIVVIGGSYSDIAVKCEEFPRPDSTTTGTGLSYSATGAGVLQSIQAALCGCEVNLISKVGGDHCADLIKDVLQEYDVNTDYIYTAQAKKTGSIVTLVNSCGENASLVYTGANAAFCPVDIENAEHIIADADICLIHGGLPEQAIIKAVRISKLHNTKTILNPARPIDGSGKENPDIPIDYFNADVLIPNLYEAADITQCEPISARREAAKLIGSDLIARGAKVVVITMGKRGCMIVDRESADHIPAFSIELVDQSGTGDAFAGALAACCGTGDPIRNAVKFASAAGALVCTKFGTIDALPSKSEIIELLQNQDNE
jgi:ribokinase